MNPYTINPPESEVVFEKICLELLKRHWSRPGLERFGKKGEEQFGVDIFDTLGESPLYGAQCKLKEQSKSLEPSEIREEVRKAKTFPSKLDHYVILTTGKVSGTAQLAIQAINQEHRAAGLFTVQLLTWDKITELLRQYSEVEQQFYGGLRAEEVAAVSSKLDHIASLTQSVASATSAIGIDGLIDEARERITPRDAQIAILLLNRLQRSKGGEMSGWHRFRVLTNLGAASLMLGKAPEAAHYFLEAKSLRPDDELAIANEVLAYHLLGQDTVTHEKAAAGIERFPHSTRLRFLWIQSAPREKTYTNLLDGTPSHMRRDAEIASALSRRAMANGSIDVAIAHAQDAVNDKPKWSQAHLLLAQVYFGKAVVPDSTATPINAEERQSLLSKAQAAADDTVAVSDTEGVLYVKAQALALKADIALLEGRKEDAAKYARDAFGADFSELSGRLAMAQAAFAIGNSDEGVRILEEALALSHSAANVSFMLGSALLGRGTEKDIVRAFDVFSTANIAHLDRDLVDPIVIGAIRSLVRAERWDDIPLYMTRPEVKDSPILVATIDAFVAVKRGVTSNTSELLDNAIKRRRPTDTRSVTDFLARTLMEAGRLSDALPLFQDLFEGQTPNFDVGLLLNCASRLRRDDVVLKTCQSLYERGLRTWEFQEFEAQYLEEYDHRKAIQRLQEFISANPGHKVAKLRLAIVAMRYAINELSKISQDTLPSPAELPMRYATAAVQVLQWQGDGTLAVDYAYRVLRAHPSEFEAHRAYLISLTPGSRPDIPATMEVVEIGSAVQYSESGETPSGWFVLENTEKPNIEFEEISASTDLAKELLGKRVGDSFILVKSPIQDRVAKITQILSKYTRRFQAVGDQMELKFGDETVIRTMRVPPAEKLTASDLEPMLQSVKARSQAVLKVRELYNSNPLTLHMYGELLGHDAHDGLINLAVTENQFVRSAPPATAALANTMARLGTKSTVVLDLSALATLRLLELTRTVLTSRGFRFVISPATFTTLQQLRADSRFNAAHGTIYYENGQHYMAEFTEDQIHRQKAAFEEWMRYVEANTTIVSASEVAALNPERREMLEKLFGRAGLESAVAALSPSHILWTDDLVFAEVAKSELGTEGTWTQATLEQLANRGLLDRAAADEAYAKLVGFDYQSTHFTGAVTIAALRASNGSVDAFPMRQMIRAFSGVFNVDRNTSLRLLAEFILRLSLEPMLPETKCLATKALLNTYPDDPATKAQLESFRRQCVRLMVLNPVAQADFTKCFDQWRKERLIPGLL